jgi:glycosyltransferase involved in cell wall biosynthesis
VTHFGPHVHSFGGTQSVIRTLRDHSIGADRVRAIATWNGSDHIANARLMARAVVVIVRRKRKTIAHFHISNGGAWLREGTLIALARARGLGVVVTLHGFEFPTFSQSHPRVVRAILARAHRIICLSEESRVSVAVLLGDVNVTILANPVNVDRESPPADETAPIVLFAGAIGKRKGVDVLVAAWRSLLEQGIDGECHIVGPAEDFVPPSLERLVVNGPVHPTEVGALVRIARLVVLPSRAEGMPMILSEALAAGRPFVATPVGGTRDITPDEDMIVPVNDSEALATAIGRYLRDGELAAVAGERGRRYIIETRSPEVIDRKLRAIYESI